MTNPVLDRATPDTITHRSHRGRTVIFLHAHPDDESIFTGVTMRRLADRGARVILVTATGGELGEPLTPLAEGESMSARRRVELEAAAACLGVDKLILFGRRDSGMAGRRSARHPLAFARGRTDALARKLAGIAERESAEAIVHYDDQGIYGHPDHVAVHRVGFRAARMAGIRDYQATVDRDHLSRAARGTHVIDLASAGGGYGRTRAEITLEIRADRAELSAKHAAMSAHASQIAPRSLTPATFGDGYAREWYVHDAARATGPDTLAELV